MKIPLTSLVALTLSFALPLVSHAAETVPKIINYQGKLTNAVGAPLAGEAGGTFRLRLEIFAQATGGEVVWAEERDVVVIGGIFNAALGGAGGVAVGGVSNVLGDAFAGPARFLQTTIVSGPEITQPQTLAPRQQLVSTPFALVSQRTDHASRSDVAALAESLIPHLAQALNPPGTVIAYAGAVTDTGGLVEPVPGYLLCNGAVIDGLAQNGKFNVLRIAVGKAWGHGGNAGNVNVFNLPDLRGVFLRGWNGLATDSYADPDRADTLRLARKTGGNVGNRVGSFQLDQFKNHNHDLRIYDTADNSGDRDRNHDSNDGGDTGAKDYATTSEGGSETRGKNANVVYLIKY